MENNKNLTAANEEVVELVIPIKYFDDSVEPIEKIQKGDWIDLRSREDILLYPGEEALIPLNVAMQLPEGYEAHLAPRSSTFKKWGIIQTNSVGVIDNTYCGDNDEWKMGVYCLVGRDDVDGVKGSMIHKGDRVAQFRIMPVQPKVKFEMVTVLGNADRNGFGSTGTN